MPGFNIRTADGCGSEIDCSGSSYTGPENTIETGRRHRYVIRVLEPVQEVVLYAYKCQRPACETDRIVMYRGQDEIYKPGKNRWMPIEITFYEVVKQGNLTARYLRRWWGQTQHRLDSSTIAPDEDYKKICDLSLTDGCGSPVWTYRMYDVWLSKISPSELSYEDSTLSEIACTLEVGKVKEIG